MSIDNPYELGDGNIDANRFQAALKRGDRTNTAFGHHHPNAKRQRDWATYSRVGTGHGVDPHKTTGSEKMNQDCCFRQCIKNTTKTKYFSKND
jgi:hypothetical protein